LKEPLVGPADNQTVNLDLMLSDYYEEMGWDENGRPKEETLKELSLPIT
jgi:aldehyde:ferredoxin oxidoreductase